jgi:hypothetical protein
MQIQCCVERPLEEQETTPPDKEADVIKLQPIPWYGKASLPPPPPRVVTTLPRTVSNATTIPN